MLSLIQEEVVNHRAWLTAQEFTDIVAISQMTPGPIGINMATYVGYSAVIEAGYPAYLAVLGSFIATCSVVFLPFALMYSAGLILLRYKDNLHIKLILRLLRPAIIGLIAATALNLMNIDNFGNPKETPLHFTYCLILFVIALLGSAYYRKNPLIIISLAAFVGLASGIYLSL